MLNVRYFLLFKCPNSCQEEGNNFIQLFLNKELNKIMFTGKKYVKIYLYCCFHHIYLALISFFFLSLLPYVVKPPAPFDHTSQLLTNSFNSARVFPLS